MNPKVKYYWLLLLIPASLIAWYFQSAGDKKPLRTLPYFGPKKSADKAEKHTVPSFSFMSQYNDIITRDSLKDDIYVTEFFFTTCKTICPVMNNNLVKVFRKYGSRRGFRILSHTVDPETDSISVLREYAARHGVNNRAWLFLTGSKKELYHMARKAYLLDDGSGEGDEEDFVHTQNFALVDKNGHIRGQYDGTDSLEIERLMQDIEILSGEYEFGKNTGH